MKIELGHSNKENQPEIQNGDLVKKRRVKRRHQN